MTWLQRYRLRHYMANSIWILPVIGMVAAIEAARLVRWIDDTMGWQSKHPPDTVQMVLSTLSSSMFTFIVFVSSALLVAVQLASSLLTPRIIATVFKDPIIKLALVVFVFTFTFTLATLVQVGTAVPALTARLAAYSCLASLAVFLYLMDHAGKFLRPSGVLWAVGQRGRRIIASVYPMRLGQRAAMTKASAF